MYFGNCHDGDNQKFYFDTEDYFFCNNGAGGTCYEASTSCFGSCPSAGNWQAPAYDSSYASYQTYCASWSENGGTFNGGRGRC